MHLILYCQQTKIICGDGDACNTNISLEVSIVVIIHIIVSGI
jgi:hypothetical protein